MLFINKIFYLINIIRRSILLTFAKNEISDRNFSKAVELLNKINIQYREHTFFIFYAICKKEMGKISEGIEYYHKALNIIDKNNNINSDEKNYIETYILLGLSELYSKNKQFDLSKKYEEKLKNKNFQIKNIKKYILYDFPLSINM